MYTHSFAYVWYGYTKVEQWSQLSSFLIYAILSTQERSKKRQGINKRGMELYLRNPRALKHRKEQLFEPLQITTPKICWIGHQSW